MKRGTNLKPSAKGLSKGQIWEAKGAYIEIVSLGIRLIDYRMMKQLGQKQVRTQTGGIQAMQDYLRTHKARLLKAVPAA